MLLGSEHVLVVYQDGRYMSDNLINRQVFGCV
jgi:hypothetical protein